MSGLGQHGTEKGWAGLQPTQIPPRDTRRSVGSSTQRHTVRRNGVPGVVLPRGASVNRRRHGGGIPPEATAAGKARGYADVGTVVCT